MKGPPEPFTMAEYIEHYKLTVSPHDVPSVRVISQYLREKGYTRRRIKRNQKVVIAWTRELRPDIPQLKEKLRNLS